MHEKVREFLEKKKAEEAQKKQKKKEKHLIDLGIYEKEYYDESVGTDINLYPLSEYSEERGEMRYYRIIPIYVSDEEYEEIKKYSNAEEESALFDNVGEKIKAFARISFILGLISSVILGISLLVSSAELPEDMMIGFIIGGIVSLVVGIVGSLITAWLIYGFGEMIVRVKSLDEKHKDK